MKRPVASRRWSPVSPPAVVSSSFRDWRSCRGLVALVFVLGVACWLFPARTAGRVLPRDARVLQESPGFKENLEQADAALKRRQYEEALTLYKRANSQANNKSPDALWGMALAYSGQGAEKNVGETLDKFLLLVGDDSKRQAAAYNLKGQAAWNLARLDSDARKYAEAEAHFKRALELQPDMVVLHYNLGLVYLSGKDDALGIEQMKLYLEKDPGGSSAASARQMIDNPRRARENYALEFSGTSVNGERISLEDLRGKVVLLDFWATWCGPCAQALPGLKRLVKRTTNEPVLVVSISGDTDAEKWRASVGENQMTWPQLLDARGQIQRAYGVEGIPTYIVIDHEGIIRNRLVGYSSWTDGDLQGAINKWLKAAKARAVERK